ncbi:MAG: hypothetical protein AB1512_08915 [Thermodesulfobacteriota bacterium]
MSGAKGDGGTGVPFGEAATLDYGFYVRLPPPYPTEQALRAKTKPV